MRSRDQLSDSVSSVRLRSVRGHPLLRCQSATLNGDQRINAQTASLAIGACPMSKSTIFIAK
jgi:hypothetical protein